MSDSDEEFASADEEVAAKEGDGSGDVEQVKKKKEPERSKQGPSQKKEVKKESSQEAGKERETANIEEAVEAPELAEAEKKEDRPKKETEVIQRQPAAGYVRTEEPKDPRAALEGLAAKESSGGGGWGFGGWGSSFLSTARSSVTAFTSQLGEGIHSVVETVESALDVPAPEEMAHKNAAPSTDDSPQEKKEEKKEENNEGKKEEKEEKEEEKPQSEDSWWGMTSSVMSSAQKTTSKLMTGGLDVLETIGKKTIEALQETDPGLARTRELFAVGGRTRTSGTLSQALRDARERNEEAALREKRWEEERLGHFGAQFEDCQGLAHLEALELLASRCEAKLHSRLGQMAGEELNTARQQLVQLKTIFERVEGEEEEMEEEEEMDVEALWVDVERALEGLQLQAKEEIMRTVKVKDQLLDCASRKAEPEESEDPKEEKKDDEDEETKKKKKETAVLQSLQQSGVQILAHVTAAWVGLFHKMGELALANSLRWTTENSEEPLELQAVTERIVDCSLLASRSIGGMGEEVATLLRKNSSEDSRRLSTQLVSALYLETGNSRSYVRDALVLLLPVLQLAALK